MSLQNATYPLTYIEKAELSDYQRKIEAISKEYLSFINKSEDLFTLSGNYIHFGTIRQPQGWIIHLSIVKSQLISLISLVIPYLIRENIPFKIPSNADIAWSLLDGKLGYIALGKIVSIYPPDETLTVTLVRELIRITGGLMGPPIPTDRQLHNIIYIRYGAFNGENVISDEKGLQMPDHYYIPFKYPAYLNWPFSEFAAPYPAPENVLLNYTYYPTQSLKSDAKGKVIKALYFRKFYQIKLCLIKEGKHNMFSDFYGRDIRDRLKWQYRIHTFLSSKIPLPKAIAYYSHNENDYFVMEYIKGDSLGAWLEKKNSDRPWKDIPISTKIVLLKTLLKIVTLIEALHEAGYVHRDINQYNLVVKQNEQIVLIDMELAWSMNEKAPSPPFQLGTRGFMSPEQEAVLTPTAKEDVYALGAMMLKFFTNVSPNKLTFKISEGLMEVLYFFSGKSNLASLVYQCLRKNPNERPSVAEIKKALQQYYISLAGLENLPDKPETLRPSSSKSLLPVITSAIAGLSHEELLSPTNLWLSKMATEENDVVNNTGEFATFEGWHTGMAGPIWVLARAKRLGFDTSPCNKPYLHSWEYLKKTFWEDAAQKSPGMYYGVAGIAMALGESMSSGSLPANEQNQSYVRASFDDVAPIGGLSSGIAGQGIALLHCANWLPVEKFSSLCHSYIQSLLETQEPDGSWKIQKNNKDKFALAGFSSGVTGIVWFLLASLQFFPNNYDAKLAVRKALNWLKSKRKYGTHNLALTFIKAYELYHDAEYKKIAEKCLYKNPARKVIEDFTLKSGLAALGETYLEAAFAFKDNQWQERAEWIAQVFAHIIQMRSKDQGFWVMEFDGTITADLFNGSSGILHFLLRANAPGKLSHPLWPIRSKNN